MQSVASLFSRWSPSLASKMLSENVGAYESRDYVKAFSGFQILAGQGNASAQAMLGIMYHEGQGVSPNYDQAVHWLRMAAEEGVPDAQFNLGVLYENGRGVPRDPSQAINWYRLAAKWGSASAQINLSGCFRDGLGVDRNESLAAWWVSLAAEQGDTDAQLILGTRYMEGLGISRDFVEAFSWFDLAARAGRSEAADLRTNAEQFLLPEQVKAARAPSIESKWKPKSPTESSIEIFRSAARQNVEAIQQTLGEEQFEKLRITDRKIPNAGELVLKKTQGVGFEAMARNVKSVLMEFDRDIDFRLSAMQSADHANFSTLTAHQTLAFIRRLDDLADVGALLGDSVSELRHNLLEFHLSLIGLLEGLLEERVLTLLLERFSLRNLLRAPRLLRFAGFQNTMLPLLPW